MKVKISEKLITHNPACISQDVQSLKATLDCYKCEQQPLCMLEAIVDNYTDYKAGIYVGEMQDMIEDVIKDAGGVDKISISDTEPMIRHIVETELYKYHNDSLLSQKGKENQTVVSNISPYTKKEVRSIKWRIFWEERILILKNIIRRRGEDA